VIQFGREVVLFVIVLVRCLDEGMRRVVSRSRRDETNVIERKVVMVHEYKGSRSPGHVPCGRLRRRRGLDEVVGIANRTESDDAESDGPIGLNGAVDIGGVEIA